MRNRWVMILAPLGIGALAFLVSCEHRGIQIERFEILGSPCESYDESAARFSYRVRESPDGGTKVVRVVIKRVYEDDREVTVYRDPSGLLVTAAADDPTDELAREDVPDQFVSGIDGDPAEPRDPREFPIKGYKLYAYSSRGRADPLVLFRPFSYRLDGRFSVSGFAIRDREHVIFETVPDLEGLGRFPIGVLVTNAAAVFGPEASIGGNPSLTFPVGGGGPFLGGRVVRRGVIFSFFEEASVPDWHVDIVELGAIVNYTVKVRGSCGGTLTGRATVCDINAPISLWGADSPPGQFDFYHPDPAHLLCEP